MYIYIYTHIYKEYILRLSVGQDLPKIRSCSVPRCEKSNYDKFHVKELVTSKTKG